MLPSTVQTLFRDKAYADKAAFMYAVLATTGGKGITVAERPADIPGTSDNSEKHPSLRGGVQSLPNELIDRTPEVVIALKEALAAHGDDLSNYEIFDYQADFQDLNDFETIALLSTHTKAYKEAPFGIKLISTNRTGCEKVTLTPKSQLLFVHIDAEFNVEVKSENLLAKEPSLQCYFSDSETPIFGAPQGPALTLTQAIQQTHLNPRRILFFDRSKGEVIANVAPNGNLEFSDGCIYRYHRESLWLEYIAPPVQAECAEHVASPDERQRAHSAPSTTKSAFPPDAWELRHEDDDAAGGVTPNGPKPPSPRRALYAASAGDSAPGPLLKQPSYRASPTSTAPPPNKMNPTQAFPPEVAMQPAATTGESRCSFGSLMRELFCGCCSNSQRDTSAKVAAQELKSVTPDGTPARSAVTP